MKRLTLPYLAAFAAGLVALALATGAMAFSATADLGEGDYITITDGECTVPAAIEAWAPIRANLRAMYQIELELHASRLVWKGIEYAGCYAIGPDNGAIYNIDSAGDKLNPPIPGEAFIPGDRPAKPMPKGGREASLTEQETYAQLARDLAQMAREYERAWRQFYATFSTPDGWTD